MNGDAPRELRDTNTPDEVIVNQKPRRPTGDPTMGVVVNADRRGQPANRLVTIGDSLTHGFQSGAIFNTRLSWPMIVAWELGWDASFRFPTYDALGGIPLNIEMLLHRLENLGDRINLFEVPLAIFEARQYMAEIEDYWERGPGSVPFSVAAPMHNMGVYGWDVRDALSRTAKNLRDSIGRPKNDWFGQIVENHNARAALRVYGSFREDETVLAAAGRLGNDPCAPDASGQSSGHGIEVLVVMLGGNNALGSVTSLVPKWSSDGYDDLVAKAAYNVWRPSHFAAEFALLVDAVSKIKARHVIFVTVPHVTVAPIARAVGTKKSRPGSRYFPFYTRPWIDENEFDARDDPNLTANQARAIDSAIDQYNEVIESSVKGARAKGMDWFVFDVATLLDRLATRRYEEDPLARPDWWTPYPLPQALSRLDPPPNTRFFQSDSSGRKNGGVFSLDGVHPTTVGYGIVAQGIINVMRLAGVPFLFGDGKSVRPDPIDVDFDRLLARDSLLSTPPRSLTSDLKQLGRLDERLEIFGRLSPFNRSVT